MVLRNDNLGSAGGHDGMGAYFTRLPDEMADGPQVDLHCHFVEVPARGAGEEIGSHDLGGAGNCMCQVVGAVCFWRLLHKRSRW